MQASMQRQFYYHSDASPLGGSIQHPFDDVVSTAASSSLAQAGGVVTARLDRYRMDPVIAVSAAYSHISGALNPTTGNWMTLTTAVVEQVNVLEVVTADRIVARLAVEHPKVGYRPKVSFVGVQFDNLRVAGHAVSVELNLDLLATGEAFPDVAYVEDGKFLQGVSERSLRMTGAKGAPEWLKERYGWVQTAEGRKQRGYVVTSLVDAVHGVGYGSVFGHVITVPDFGNIFLGELMLDMNSYHLTMMRLELGCPAVGTLSLSTTSSNGYPIP